MLIREKEETRLLEDGTLLCYVKNIKTVKKVVLLDNKDEKLWYKSDKDEVRSCLSDIHEYVLAMYRLGLGKQKSLEFIEKFIVGKMEE